MAKGYTHLTAEERCQIYGLLKSGMSKSKIAKELCRHETSIWRELARNQGDRGYRFKQAQEKATARRHKASAVMWRMMPDLIEIIEDKIALQWSPVQISGWLEKSRGLKISYEWIYQHIRADRKSGGTLYKNLRHGGKKYNRRVSKDAGRGLIPGRVDIDQRPEIVDTKCRIGDWELDTVIGAQQKGVIVSAVDRMSKYTIFEKVPDKSAASVTAALKRRLGACKSYVLTLTADNGKEFAGHKDVAENLEADFFFAKPYHSWERGLNEHTNGLLRQYFPKGSFLADITNEQLDKVEALINNRPRKVLDFNTPQEVFFGTLGQPPPRALHC